MRLSRHWTLEEDLLLRKLIAERNTSTGAIAFFVGRSRNSIVSRAARLGLAFGLGEVPGRREAVRLKDREQHAASKGRTEPFIWDSWDQKLFEPWAERKARLARERAA